MHPVRARPAPLKTDGIRPPATGVAGGAVVEAIEARHQGSNCWRQASACSSAAL